MPIYRIKRKGLYFRVNNKMQAMEVGTEVEMTGSKGETWIKRGFAERVEVKKPKKAKKKKIKDIEALETRMI